MAINIEKTKIQNQMKTITSKGVEESNNKVIKDIPLNMIDPHPDNKEIYSLTDIESLVRSIEDIGFMGSIEVYLKPDGRYQISAGHRRYEAMKILKKKTIPCIVNKLEDDYTVRKKLIESNINTRVVSPIELSRSILYYERILNESGYPGSVNKELSKVFNISESKISKLKSLNKLTTELQDMAYSLNFPYEAFSEAVSFTKEQQFRLFNLIKEHFKKFPEAELTTILVSQFIQQVKSEIKLEKERLERAKIQKQAQIEIQKQLENQKVEQSQQVDTPVVNTVEQKESSNYFNNIINPDSDLSSPLPDQPFDFETISYDTEPVEAKTIVENKAIVEPEVKEIVAEPENTIKKIDFELNLYAKRIADLLSSSQAAISPETKQDIITVLNSVIEKLQNL